MKQTVARGRAAGAEGGTGGIRTRSSDPTAFDNADYMAELEANLLKAMNITDNSDTAMPAYGSTATKPTAVKRNGAKSGSRTRQGNNGRDDSPTKPSQVRQSA